MIDDQRNVGVQGLPDRLTVVPALGDRNLLQILFDPIGDLVQDDGALGRRGFTPARCRLMGGVQGEIDIRGGGAGNLGEHLAVDR
jgi:hypothetical protein